MLEMPLLRCRGVQLDMQRYWIMIAGSIEAILTAKPARPAFKHPIKTISDWWSVEKQIKNWFDGIGHDFFIQIKKTEVRWNHGSGNEESR